MRNEEKMPCFNWRIINMSSSKGMRLRPLVLGDLILRKVLNIAKNPAWGKLGPNWEGPYRITSVVGIGA